MMSATVAGHLPAPARPRSRPPLRPPAPARRWPLAGLAISLGAHLLLAGAVGLALMWGIATPARTYVVNLVPAVAAVGVPTAPRAKSVPAPSVTPQPPRPAETPRAPVPPAPLPPRPLPARESARLPEPALPSRSLPARTATLRPGDKEMPPLATPSTAPRVDPRAERPVAEPPRPAAPQAVRGLRTGSPAGAGALTLEASDFPHAWYLRQVHQKIEDEWRRRPPGSEPGQRPVILVEIMRDGTIRSPRVEQSSGSAFYDQAALRAVVGASPFPPLPGDWSRPTLRVMLGFSGMEGG